MAERTLAQNVAQAIADFKAIKEAINIHSEMPEETPTSEYANHIDGVAATAFNAGIKSEYDRFWDNYQENGNRTVYASAFGSGWTAETFKPKYSIKPTNAHMMFYNNVGNAIKIDDFVEFCERQGIELDLSNSKHLAYALGCLHTKRFGVIDASKAETTNYMFYSNTTLTTIDEFISSETTVYSTDTFSNATNLTNIIMSGVVAKAISFYKNTKLTKASIESIVNCLSTTTSALTVTFSKTAVNNAFTTDEWAALIATKPNWTISLV